MFIILSTGLISQVEFERKFDRMSEGMFECNVVPLWAF